MGSAAPFFQPFHNKTSPTSPCRYSCCSQWWILFSTRFPNGSLWLDHCQPWQCWWVNSRWWRPYSWQPRGSKCLSQWTSRSTQHQCLSCWKSSFGSPCCGYKIASSQCLLPVMASIALRQTGFAPDLLHSSCRHIDFLSPLSSCLWEASFFCIQCKHVCGHQNHDDTGGWALTTTSSILEPLICWMDELAKTLATSTPIPHTFGHRINFMSCSLVSSGIQQSLYQIIIVHQEQFLQPPLCHCEISLWLPLQNNDPNIKTFWFLNSDLGFVLPTTILMILPLPLIQSFSLYLLLTKNL